MRGADSYRGRQGSMSTYRGRSRERERDWAEYRGSISGGSGAPGQRGSISGYRRSRSRSRDRMDRDRERDRDLRDRDLRTLDTSVGGGMPGTGSGGGFASAYRQRSPRERERDLMRDRDHRVSISGGPMGMDHRDRVSNFPPPLPPGIMERDRIDREREREREIAMRRSRSRERSFRERDSRDRDRERDKERELLRDSRERDIRYAAVGLKSSGGSDSYDPSRGEREQRAKAAAEWNRNREAERARFSSNNHNNPEPGSATSPGTANGSNLHQQGQPQRHVNQPPTAGSGPPSSQWSGRRNMSIGGASNAPPPGPPVSVPRFGFTPNVPLKERESQEQRDKDNRSGDNKATGNSVTAPRVETTNRDQQPQKQDRNKPEEQNSARAEPNLGGRRSPPPPITVPPPSAAGNSPLSGCSSTSRPYLPTLPANQQHQPYYHQSQSQPPQQLQQQQQQQQQQPPPQQQQQSSQPSQQQGPPSGPRGVPPPTGPRANNSSAPPPRGPGFDRERERIDVRAREASAANKWGALREKAEAIQQAAPYSSPGTSMIHPDRLKGIEIAERTELPKDRDTHTINLQSPSPTIPPPRQEQKHLQHQQTHQQHHRSPLGLVSTSASATGSNNLSHDTSPGSHNNSVVGGDSSNPWNPSRPPTHAGISPSTAHKPLPLPLQPQTSIRSSAPLDKPQHSLSSILNPDGLGSGEGYTFGSASAITSAVNTNNNVNLSTSNITTTSIAAVAGTGYATTTTTTNTSGSASTNPFSMGAQRTSPQAAPTNVPSTPTLSTATLVNSAASPPVAASASSSPQMPVKQVPTGPRAERANQHIPHGHSHSHAPHMNRGRGYWSVRSAGFRGRGGEAPGMVVKREFDDDSQAGIGSGYRGGRGGSGEWVGARARGGFDGTGRGLTGRRDARFGSVDRMESSAPGSLGGVAGVVSSAVGKGVMGGSLMRRNSLSDIETAESEVDRAFDGRDRTKEMEHERERIEGVAQMERYQPSGAFGEGKTEIKVERIEGQSQPGLPFSVMPTDSNQSLAPHRLEVVKPVAPLQQQQQQAAPVVTQPSRVEEPLQPQIVTTIQTEDRMDVDDSDEEVLTQEDVVSKIGEIDQELVKLKDRLAELGRRKQACQEELEALDNEEVEEVKEKEQRQREERLERERVEAARELRKEKEERERLRKENESKENDKRERLKAEKERLRVEQEKEKEQERERLEKEKEKKRMEKEKLERERQREKEREAAEERKKREKEEKERVVREKKADERITREREVERMEEEERIVERTEQRQAERVNEQVKGSVVGISAEEPQDEEMTTVHLEKELKTDAEAPGGPLEPEFVKTEENAQEPMKAEIPEVPVKPPVDEEVTMTGYTPAVIPTPTEPVEEHEAEEDREADADGEFEDDDGYVYDDGEASSRSNQSIGSPTSFVMDEFMAPPPLADGEAPPFHIPTRAELESCLSALPHFRHAPRESKEYAIFQKANEVHGQLKPILLTIMQDNARFVYEKEQRLKEEYVDGYEPYLKELRKLENEEQGKKKPGAVGEAVEQDASPTLLNAIATIETAAATAAATATTTGRRGGRNAAPTDVVHSEAEMEAIIQILTDQDAQAQADKVRREKSATEAVIPDMILDPLERRLGTFQDYSNLLTDDRDRRIYFGTLVPSDDWTEAEQQLFTERYMQTPKQWQKIAEGLPGRTYKDCIRHYYLTKKCVGYKEKMRLPRRGKRKGAKPRNTAWANGQAQPRTRQSKLINADAARKAAGTPIPTELKVTGEEDEGADSEDVNAPITDTGRPRRAAAPVFGGDNVVKQQDLSREDSESATPAPGNGKRSGGGGGGGGGGSSNGSARGNAIGNAIVTGDEDSVAERGSKRVRVNSVRKEGGKRTKPPATPLAEREKTTKEEKRKEELEAKESDAVSALAGLSGHASVATTKGLEERASAATPMQAPIPILPQQPQQILAPYNYNIHNSNSNSSSNSSSSSRIPWVGHLESTSQSCQGLLWRKVNEASRRCQLRLQVQYRSFATLRIQVQAQ
ncbi:hypothetical protein EV426DRAFT_447030 [Tirmania nivea]|nr:hypothetical protein EV426DRAFT_447030 [Tirmania nivea]